MVKTERTVSVSLEDGKKMQRIPPVRNYQIWMFVYEKFFFQVVPYAKIQDQSREDVSHKSRLES